MTRTIETPKGPVSALLEGPEGGPLLVLAHGAGNDMRTPLFDGLAQGLASRGVATLRFNFPYKEQGRRAPDPERTLRDAWLAAFEHAAALSDVVWVGGKSLGGRIASLVVTEGLAAAGIVFVGYPLHPPGKPERIRDAHLPGIEVPMLFLQGTKDPFARWELLEPLVERLPDATLHPVDGGDHSFRVRGQPKDDAATGRALGEVAGDFIRERS
ncbi:MAG TPA: alpha/beta family hydrolase [Actinomycetota bacterium]